MVLKHHVEHEETVNGIIYRVVRESDFDACLDFYFDVFLKDEPSTKSFGGYQVRHPAMVQQMRDVLEDGLTVVAIDPAQGHRLIGFRTAYSVQRDDERPEESLEENLKIFPETHAYIMHLFGTLMAPSDIFKAHPDVTKIYDMFTLACHPDYRGRGIASELVRQALKVAKKSGCDCAIVLSTNDFTRRIFEKLGMATLKETQWEDCQINGKQIFGKVESRHATSHFIRL